MSLRKREQLYMDHELKRQKVMVEANTTPAGESESRCP